VTERWVSLVRHDRTCLVVNFCEWNLTGNDQTLVLVRPVTSSSASGHNLIVLMTIEIGRSVFEVGDMWPKSKDQTLGSCVQ